MIEFINDILMKIIFKIVRTDLPWKYTSRLMQLRDTWYRKHRKWCDSCNDWVSVKEIHPKEKHEKLL